MTRGMIARACQSRLRRVRRSVGSHERIRNSWFCAAVLLMVVPRTADAQSSGDGETAFCREAYRVEFAGGLWNVSPDVAISADALEEGGPDLDFVRDADLVKKRLLQLRIVVQPVRRHKLRISYVPTHLEAETTLNRTIVFRGIDYAIGLPMSVTMSWNTTRFGYQFDLVSASRGFAGVVGEARYARLGARVNIGGLGLRSTSIGRWIPAVGVASRLYLGPRFAVGGEVTWFHVPELLEIAGDAGGRSMDFDISGIVTLTSRLSAQAGFRTLDVAYRRNDTAAHLGLQGLYINTLLRF